MKMQIILATGNENKVHELREIISDPEVSIRTMREAGVAADPDENGSTFEENALIKACAVWKLLHPTDVLYDTKKSNTVTNQRPNTVANQEPNTVVNQKLNTGANQKSNTETETNLGTPETPPVIVMSDDSGLVIDALNGAPGIHSARFMGHDTSYTVKMNAILEQMKDVPEEKRTARFVCAAAAILPDGKTFTTIGTMEGRIAYAIAGENGFGYDPFFYLPEYGKTSAQLGEEEKNAISHRGKAFREMMQVISRLT